jgi:hypothetical protein
MGPPRTDLLGGDFRSLYLGWLAALQAGEIEADDPEPRVPTGIKRLSASLRSMAEFLRIDAKLLKAVAASDVGEPPSAPSRKDLAAWIHSLAGAKKDEFLLQLADFDSPHLRGTLLQQFRRAETKKATSKDVTTSKTRRRTAGELLAAAGLG